ncbi:MAG: hypothetical protein JW993_10225 [Sedimentisphaerales bacterium]|nr:hypothetical protein [Sedimentisphaerales bacterium]
MATRLKSTFLSPIQSTAVAPASGATINHQVDTTRNLHAITLHFDDGGVDATEAQIKADIGLIKVQYNGVDIVRATATELCDILSYYEDAVSTGFIAGTLRIPLTRRDLPTAALNQLFAIGMVDAQGRPQNLTAQIACAGTVTNIDGCNVGYEYDLADPRPLGLHMRLLQHTRTFASTGQKAVTDLPIKGRNAILAYHIHDTTGTITQIELKQGEFDLIANQAVNFLKDRDHRAGWIWQTNYTHVNLATQGDLNDGMPAGDRASGVILTPNWPSTGPGGNYTIIEECMVNGL